MHISKYETVTTDKLHSGDVVYSHGGTFRLTMVRETLDERSGRIIYAWKTQPVDVSECLIPESWIRDWTIQGNNLACWARLK